MLLVTIYITHISVSQLSGFSRAQSAIFITGWELLVADFYQQSALIMRSRIRISTISFEVLLDCHRSLYIFYTPDYSIESSIQ